ncbi:MULTISPECIES: GNAT family N-acetyltransferase [unclassified Parafrankia]|uniref:GNAT family N-acetyltransferase n=1 Tax=unclassified Parafrankia TaxID=2994368 RepID=UPI000DA56D02|nr:MULTISPECIES: GNAT family N-acetyltransferase [unclassified Parafrankia]TCJ35018.1 GNAT family N-acetyltransferase [Parafrankia sp. BMG5.11]SQD97312.1 GCN5-related N-acetyltransferase [Parafrankia sp. Ea1.12]
MQVRQAGVADAEGIARVHVLSSQAGYRGLLPQPLLDGLRPAQRVPRWTATVRQTSWPGRGVLVADDAGAIVGFVDLRPAEDDDPDAVGVGEITGFYVLPAAWRQGVGRHLMAAAVRGLHAAGYMSAMLWVLEANTRAVRFYSQLGWEPDGSSRDRLVRYRRNLG